MLTLAEPRATARASRVLVVDDDRSFRRMLVAALDHEGFDVLGAATDGLEGVAMAASLRPDAIMLDVRMGGGLDGLAAGRKIRDTDPAVRLVFLSAYDDQTLQRVAEDLGATDFLVKGCRLSEIVDALTR
jgi:DNA-binding response OmpR family regulator